MVGLYFLTLEGLQIIKSLWELFTSEVFFKTLISFLVKPDFSTLTEKVNMLGNFSVFPTLRL